MQRATIKESIGFYSSSQDEGRTHITQGWKDRWAVIEPCIDTARALVAFSDRRHMRDAEIRGLLWGRVDLKNAVLTVGDGKTWVAARSWRAGMAFSAPLIAVNAPNELGTKSLPPSLSFFTPDADDLWSAP